MNKLFTIAFLFFAKIIYAQKDTISYTVIHNNPRDIAHTSIYFTPANLISGIFNPAVVGYNVGLKTSFGNEKYALGLSYVGCYANYFDFNTYNSINDGWVSANNSNTTSNKTTILADIKAFRSLEVKIGYTFKEITENKPSFIDIYTDNSKNTTYYIKPMYTERRILRLNAGFKSFSSAVNLFNINSNSDDFFIEATDGTKFYQSSIAYADVDYQRTNDSYFKRGGNVSSNGVGWITQMSVKSLFVGISKTKVSNFAIDTQYGKRSEVESRTTYFDIFYAPSININPIVFFASNPFVALIQKPIAKDFIGDTPKEFELKRNSKNGVSVIPFGIRFGIDSHTLYPIKLGKWKKSATQQTKGLCLGNKLEIGYLPGLRTKGFYTQISFYVPFINF